MVQEGVLVLDNGAHTLRAGWAHEHKQGPAVSIRNLVMKGRSRAEGHVFTMVGDVDPQVLVGLDTSRGPIKSPFESNVVCNFEAQEIIFDHLFDRMGLEGGQLNHELVLTECVQNPLASRQIMAELLFESYGCPAFHTGPDCSFAYGLNLTKGIAKPDGIVVGMGHSCTNIVAFRNGMPDFERSCRFNVGGLGLTSYMQRILELRYNTGLNNKEHPLAGVNLAEKMKEHICYVSANYPEDLRKIQSLNDDGVKKNQYQQKLPFDILKDFPDFNLDQAVEKIQVPELYFQPGISGINQCSLPECIAHVDERYSQAHSVGKHFVNESILLVGGGSNLKGFKERLQSELQSLCMRDSKMNIISSQESTLDAWNGAAGYANKQLVNREAYAESIKKAEYEEIGRDRVFIKDK